MQYRVSFLVLSVYSAFGISLASANCSREDVSFYLDKGFSHEQVVKICGAQSASGKTSTPAAPARVNNGNLYEQIGASNQPSVKSAHIATLSTSSQPAPSSADVETKVFLNSVMKAEVVITPTHIILSKDNDCIPYGTEDAVGFINEACVQTRTQISRAGLKVVLARKPIPILGKPEFVVSGKIQRQILNPEVLNQKQQSGLASDYPLTPSQVDIPVRRDVDIKKLERTIERLAL